MIVNREFHRGICSLRGEYYLTWVRYNASPGFHPQSLVLLVSPRRSAPTKKPIDPAPAQFVDVYRSFVVWKSKAKPKWHSIQKMRYVFWRMMSGKTITDAVREIHWTPREFWRAIDIERDEKHPFREEYDIAKLLQSRAIADSVLIIAEARDANSRRRMKQITKLVRRALVGTKGSKAMASMIAKSVAETLGMHEKDLIARNKLQIDAAKWFAAKTNPNEFADKSSIGLGGLPHTGDGAKVGAIEIAFVGADGKEIPFDPTVPAPKASE